MADNASCSTCRFSAPGPEPGKLTCRRYPPIAFPMLVPGAPPGQVAFLASVSVVAPNAWCGEYKAKLVDHAALGEGGDGAPKYGRDTNTGRPIVSFDEGKTWQWFDGARSQNRNGQKISQ